jgi:hypothetical protein
VYNLRVRLSFPGWGYSTKATTILPPSVLCITWERDGHSQGELLQKTQPFCLHQGCVPIVGWSFPRPWIRVLTPFIVLYFSFTNSWSAWLKPWPLTEKGSPSLVIVDCKIYEEGNPTEASLSSEWTSTQPFWSRRHLHHIFSDGVNNILQHLLPVQWSNIPEASVKYPAFGWEGWLCRGSLQHI